MKKFYTLVLVAFLGGAAFSQGEAEATSTKNYKFSSGDKNIEVNVDPFAGTKFSQTGIRFRYFLSENSAFRVGFDFTKNSSNTLTQEAHDSTELEPYTDLELEDKSSSSSFNIAPAYEIHFEGTDRLSPYVGAGLSLGLGSSRTVTQSQEDVAADGTDEVGTVTSKYSWTSFGLGVLAGADYYFTEKLYLGMEVSYGLGLTSAGKTTIENDNLPTGATNPEPSKVGSPSTFDLGANTNAQFRIGFLF